MLPHIFLLMVFIFMFFSAATCQTTSVRRETKIRSYWNDEWNRYSLGDIIKSSDQRGVKFKLEEYGKKYPKSIATEYLNKTLHLAHQNQKYNWNILCNIVKERSTMMNVSFPSSNDIIIHLRLGDVADESYYSNNVNGKELFINGTTIKGSKKESKRHYIKTREYYGSMLNRIPTSTNIKIVLVGSDLHVSNKKNTYTAPKHTHSIEYREALISFLKTEGKFTDITTRWNHLPDEDFLYMSNSKIFIYSGGGFSHIIGECVRRLGGVTPMDYTK